MPTNHDPRNSQPVVTTTFPAGTQTPAPVQPAADTIPPELAKYLDPAHWNGAVERVQRPIHEFRTLLHGTEAE